MAVTNSEKLTKSANGYLGTALTGDDPSQRLGAIAALAQGSMSYVEFGPPAMTLLQRIDDGKSGAVYESMIEDLQSGPHRYGTVLRDSRVSRGEEKATGNRRLDVLFDNGESASVLLSKEMKAVEFRLGDTVACDKGGFAVLGMVTDGMRPVGEETVLERIIGTDRVLIVDQKAGGKRGVYRVTFDLECRIRAGEVKKGDSVIVCHKRQMAFDAIPAPEDIQGGLRFVCREAIPDILVSRDIANPPKFIDELTKHVRAEMTAPEVRRKYDLKRCVTQLLTGVSGSGKTLSVLALWRRLYEEMAEVHKVEMASLPHRVFRLKSSQVLSKWFGESEQNFEQFFNEVEEAAREEVELTDGRKVRLPVLAILEEIDGLTGQRGNGELVQDRILTTLLQRLDTTRKDLADALILFVATTNTEANIDAAALRRIGGRIERFGRLDKAGFSAVTEKIISGRPIVGGSLAKFVKLATEEVYVATGEAPPVEVETVDGKTYRRHADAFLTAAIVAGAVEESASLACERETNGGKGGIKVEEFVGSVLDRVGHVIKRLDRGNVSHYVDLPKGAVVRTVKVERTENAKT